MKSIEDKLKLMLNNAISYAYERRTNFRGAYIKIYEEIRFRFAEKDDQIGDLISKIADKDKKIAELETAYKELFIEHGLLKIDNDFNKTHLKSAEALIAELEKQEDLKKKYQELIYDVGKKYPNESRHETALRYIKNAEKSSDNTAKADKE